MIAITRMGLASVLSLACAGFTQGQDIRVTTPLTSVNDSFFERTGVNFGFHFNGGRGPGSRVVGLLPNGQVNPTGQIVFGQNGVNSAIPPFGGFDPNAQGTFGFGVIGNNGGFNVGLFGGKGSSRSSVTTAPSIVVPNGGIGSIFSGQLRPFVTGISPVLGQGQLMPPGYLDRPISQSAPVEPPTYSDPHSTAMQGDLSVDEIVRQREAESTRQASELLDEIHELVQTADELAANEKYGAARVKFARAIRKMQGISELDELREAVNAKLSELQHKR